jgi:hypothetical protein
VLYLDTDSVIFTSRHGDIDPPLGDYLGDLTDELKGDTINSFVAAGPKNYSYRQTNGKEVCKVRGFTLNFTNSQLINFTSVRDMVTSEDQDGVITTTNPSKISRDKYGHRIYNKVERKRYRMTYNKRVIQPEFVTLPYGY